jgi:hypothetical protein
MKAQNTPSYSYLHFEEEFHVKCASSFINQLSS